MTERLVLDYVASRDGVPALTPGTPPFRRERLLALDDARAPFRWSAGPRESGLMPALARRPGTDPRSGGQARSITLNADAQGLLAAGNIGYDAAAGAITLSNRPLTRDVWAAMGPGSNRDSGKTHLGAELHSGQHGLGYGRVEVEARLGGHYGVWYAPIWLIANGDPNPAVIPDPYAEFGFEAMGWRPRDLHCYALPSPPRLDADGAQRRLATGEPLWLARGNAQIGGWVPGLDHDPDGFHTYGVELTPEAIRWRLDGVLIQALPTPPALRDRAERARFQLHIDCKMANESAGWGKAARFSDPDTHVMAIRAVRAWEDEAGEGGGG